MDDLPRYHDPTCCNSGNYNTATDIDVLREEIGHIVGTGDDVGGQVGSDLSHDPAETDEESPSTAGWPVPLRGQGERIPDIFAINDHGCGGGDDTEKAEHELDERKEGNLPVHSLRLF